MTWVVVGFPNTCRCHRTGLAGWQPGGLHCSDILTTPSLPLEELNDVRCWYTSFVVLPGTFRTHRCCTGWGLGGSHLLEDLLLPWYLSRFMALLVFLLRMLSWSLWTMYKFSAITLPLSLWASLALKTPATPKDCITWSKQYSFCSCHLGLGLETVQHFLGYCCHIGPGVELEVELVLWWSYLHHSPPIWLAPACRSNSIHFCITEVFLPKASTLGSCIDILLRGICRATSCKVPYLTTLIALTVFGWASHLMVNATLAAFHLFPWKKWDI
jgi:hypothetical protein